MVCAYGCHVDDRTVRADLLFVNANTSGPVTLFDPLNPSVSVSVRLPSDFEGQDDATYDTTQIMERV